MSTGTGRGLFLVGGAIQLLVVVWLVSNQLPFRVSVETQKRRKCHESDSRVNLGFFGTGGIKKVLWEFFFNSLGVFLGQRD